jgi:hypothetical protein
LTGVVGAALVLGSPRAQAPGGASQAHTPEAIYGLWAPTPECRLEDTIIAIGPRIILESGASIHSHAFVRLSPAPDGVLVTPVRNVVSRNGTWATRNLDNEGRGWVFQRRGETLVIVRVVDRDGRDQVPPDQARTALYACK